jgi:rRNA maturation protein Nop10
MSSNCPKCGKQGYVINKLRHEVLMECPDCKRTTWYTLSKICPGCGRPNGFAVDGLCAQCYGGHIVKREGKR